MCNNWWFSTRTSHLEHPWSCNTLELFQAPNEMVGDLITLNMFLLKSISTTRNNTLCIKSSLLTFVSNQLILAKPRSTAAQHGSRSGHQQHMGFYRLKKTCSPMSWQNRGELGASTIELWKSCLMFLLLKLKWDSHFMREFRLSMNRHSPSICRTSDIDFNMAIASGQALMPATAVIQLL